MDLVQITVLLVFLDFIKIMEFVLHVSITVSFAAQTQSIQPIQTSAIFADWVMFTIQILKFVFNVLLDVPTVILIGFIIVKNALMDFTQSITTTFNSSLHADLAH